MHWLICLKGGWSVSGLTLPPAPDIHVVRIGETNRCHVDEFWFAGFGDWHIGSLMVHGYSAGEYDWSVYGWIVQ